MKFIKAILILAVMAGAAGAVAAASAPASSYIATSSYRAPQNGKKVFIFQDFLMDSVSQQKASEELGAFLEKEKIRILFVPGASGDVSLSGLRGSVPAERVQKVASDYLSDGRLTTAEYLSLTSARDLKVWGVEEPDLFAHFLEVTAHLLQRSSSFRRLRENLEKKIGPDSRAALERLFEGKATPDDLNAYEGHPEKFIPTAADPREAHSFQETVSTLVEFQNASDARLRFAVQNILRTLKLNKQEQAVFLVPGLPPQSLQRELRDNHISYEIFQMNALPQTDFPGLEKRLFEDAGMPGPGAFRANDWKSAFLQQAPLAVRPAREALVFDLLRDQKPLFWQLGESLGFSAAENLRQMLNGLPESAANVLKQNQSKVRFSWMKGLFEAQGGEESFEDPRMILWQQQAIVQIEKEYNRQKYEAFSQLVRKTEFTKNTEREEELVGVRRYVETYEKALLEAEKRADEKKKSFLDIPWIARVLAQFKNLVKGIPSAYKAQPGQSQKVLKFLRGNVTASGLPLSYRPPKGYWKTFQSAMTDVDSAMERLLTEHSVSIYDAALWQMALMLSGNPDDARLAFAHTERLLSGKSGELAVIRAYDPIFKYGDQKKVIPQDNAYFFRIISDQYLQEDPLGFKSIPEFPNFPELHHEDWKPITGEQAWGVIIGPLQSAYLTYGERIPYDCPEMRLALSILPAVEAMQSPIGAVYHAPDGTYGKNPHEISNENNCSLFAALRILRSLLKDGHPEEAARVEKLMREQLDYFKIYGFEKKDGVFNQGGLYLNGQFWPGKIFATDCQTWAINALTPQWIDGAFGHGTSYRMWQKTKERVGYFDEKDILQGVGFTDGHNIYSVEWTCGAILSVRILAEFYQKTDPAWAEELKRDAVTMRYGIEHFKTAEPDGSTAYLYSNRRYFIPWGWWANPIPSLAASSWVILVDSQFDPFILGGGPGYHPSKNKP